MGETNQVKRLRREIKDLKQQNFYMNLALKKVMATANDKQIKEVEQLMKEETTTMSKEVDPRYVERIEAQLDNLEAEIQQLRTEREELMKALEMFTILNTAHYKDIAGLINNAADTLNRMKEAGR